MIVRCTNCNSAFAVDDAKVQNKKFAFTCPKCDNENVIDNRLQVKSSLAGPAIVDEALRETGEDISPERGNREEALVGRGPDDVFDELPRGKGYERSSGRDLISEDDILLDESPAIDTDDLSGLAEPEHDTESSLETAELPPADDMQSDVPLDDLLLDDELKDLDMAGLDKEEKSNAPESGKKTISDDTDSLIFEEQNEDISAMKTESDLIHDELDALEDAGEPVELAEVDDIDKLLAEDEKEKEIVDDFEPIELDSRRPSKAVAEPDLILDDEIKTEEMYRADGADDESITIDLDTLDIDLENDEGKPVAGGGKAGGLAAPDEADVTMASASPDDENITIDLDTLDIDLQEGEEVSRGESQEDLGLDLSDFSDETVQELEGASKPLKHAEEEDITLNLDELDISLEESDEIRNGEILDEDEKLTLEDAGLTLEELTTDELSSVSARSDRKDEEDIKLTIEEVDPDFDMQAIEKELKEAESILSEAPGVENDRPVIDELADLPDIDFDEELEIVDINGKAAAPVSLRDDDLIKIDEEEKSLPKRGGLKKELPDMVPRGAVNVSIDYSLKYSRVGALLRLFGLFFIGLIPHFAVFFVYNMLSLILSGLNHLIVIATGKNVEDFSGIHENTLRYLLSISSSMIGIVEEMPVYAGRDNIDYPLQLRVVYPLRSSKLLALLRLTGIGIVLFSLPHLLILGIISLLIPVLFLVGEISVLVTGGWPHMLFEFMTRYYRYSARVLAFNIGLVDVYPSFKFD